MKLLIVKRVLCLAAPLVLPWAATGQTSGATIPESAREFVQGFYEWYGPIALREDSVPASDVALKEKHSAFSPELARLLQEDSDAQARCSEIVGIDFDPFLFSQDPAERYEVGAIHQRGRFFRADVYGIQAGNRNRSPDVVAEFAQNGDRWTFVNFYYTNPNADLLSILKSPRAKCTVPRLPDKADP
jgi:hypothetical protein